MFQYLSLTSTEVRSIEDTLEVYQAAHEFRFEVEKRQAHEDYCQWYYKVAAQNQAELAAMQDDVDVFGWFCNRHDSSAN